MMQTNLSISKIDDFLYHHYPVSLVRYQTLLDCIIVLRCSLQPPRLHALRLASLLLGCGLCHVSCLVECWQSEQSLRCVDMCVLAEAHPLVLLLSP